MSAVRRQRISCGLTGLAAHVRAGDKREVLLVVVVGVVRDDLVRGDGVEDRVPRLLDRQRALLAVLHPRPGVGLVAGERHGRRKGEEQVEHRHRLRRLVETGDLLAADAVDALVATQHN